MVKFLDTGTLNFEKHPIVIADAGRPLARGKAAFKDTGEEKVLLVQISEVGEGVPNDPQGLYRWLTLQSGYEDCILCCPDFPHGWMLIGDGVDDGKLKDFGAFKDRDWREVRISATNDPCGD